MKADAGLCWYAEPDHMPKAQDLFPRRLPRPGAARVLARLMIVALVIACVRSVIADWNDVPTGSMRPTIIEGDRIVVNKLAYGLRLPFTHLWLAAWSGPRRGDIVTFASPVDGIRMVKRIIGLPGDRVQIDNNALIINGRAWEYAVHPGVTLSPAPDGAPLRVVVVDESEQSDDEAAPAAGHTILLTPGLPSPRSVAELVVPPGSYFVMGDNRDLSNDSRLIGFVPRESIYGRCTVTAMSFDRDNHFVPRADRWFLSLR